jgi:integrase
MRLCDVERLDIQRWVQALAEAGYLRSTAQTALGWVRSIFQEGVEDGILARNPAARVQFPTMGEGAKTREYGPAEAAALASQTGLEGLLLRTMILTGVRPGEALALGPGDVAAGALTVSKSLQDSGSVKTTKTGKTRVVALSPRLAVELAALADSTPAGSRLFGRWNSVSYLQQYLRTRLAAVVPGFTLRRCRTTFATLLNACGPDASDVQALLGHAALRTTLEFYRRSVPERQALTVAELERRVIGERVQ